MNKIIAILRDLRPEYDFLDQNDFIELCRKAFQGMEVAFS